MSGRPARKYSQAARLHDMIRLIEARHGVTLEELGEETGVNRRTVHRDLDAIQEAGYPLVSEWEQGRKVYRFITGFRDVPPISFTLPELMTLSLFRSQLDFLRGTPFHDDMESIARKVRSVLPPRFAAHMERMAQVALPLLSGARDYGRVAAALGGLREALLYQYRVILSYTATGRDVTERYEMDPYTLIFHKGGLYLLGYAHNRQALRTFAVERVSGVEVLRERFEIPDDFNADEQLGRAFGIVDEPVMAVKVRFSAAVAPSIRERTWHPSQRVVDESDGAIVLLFEAGGRREILAWLLSYGDYAELLEPADLREEAARIVREMGKRYG